MATKEQLLHNILSSMSNIEFLNSFIPTGYRFRPTEAELISVYLKSKISGEDLPRNNIHEESVYDFDPDHLRQRYLANDEEEVEMYFFTPRNKKYKGGERPSRSAGEGYWKATGRNKEIKDRNVIVGFRRSLVYYVGKQPKGTKTDWLMREYTLIDHPSYPSSNAITMKLNDCILCKIYKNAPSESTNNAQHINTNHATVDQTQNLDPNPSLQTQNLDPNPLQTQNLNPNPLQTQNLGISPQPNPLQTQNLDISPQPNPLHTVNEQAALVNAEYFSINESRPFPNDNGLLALSSAEYVEPGIVDGGGMYFAEINMEEFIFDLNVLFPSPPSLPSQSQDENVRSEDKGKDGNKRE